MVGYSVCSAPSYSLSVVEPSNSIPAMGSVKPVGTSGTVSISAFALPSFPIFKTTDCERVGRPGATELALGNGFRKGLMGDDRPLDGLFRMPLVEAIMPVGCPSEGRLAEEEIAVWVKLLVNPGRSRRGV